MFNKKEGKFLTGFRKKYPQFIYENYFYKISKNNLEIIFDFKIPPDISFRHQIIIKNIPETFSVKTKKSIDNLAFHLGLIEIPTYWKTTCSPEIKINTGFLNSEQANWWKNLIIKGMGQFFYENKINWQEKNFLTLKCQNKNKSQAFAGQLKNRYLVPFSGGRDSIVTLENLKKNEIALFMVNPNKIIEKTAQKTKIKKQIIIKRIIDKNLLKLNEKGYLNGHTPFTAVLSFLSVFTAVLFNYKNIAFSNEKSADQGNLKYLNKIINHQWAKSSEFEKMFKKYCKKYLAKQINYFSYLRKYNELKISQMFANYPQYFSVFSSCNASMKTRKSVSAKAKKTRWCGNCPKCLFVYASLYPILNTKDLLKIFNKDIFENKKLLLTMKALIGESKHKPFECVGTKKESKLIFFLSLKKAKESGKIPYLLTKLK
jgi:UDP-N-acetyl-alpha-D-muramoyl-L-alanyl-L-glutamate epimerase